VCDVYEVFVRIELFHAFFEDLYGFDVLSQILQVVEDFPVLFDGWF